MKRENPKGFLSSADAASGSFSSRSQLRARELARQKGDYAPEPAAMSMMTLRSEKSRAELEAYCMALELEAAVGALPPADEMPEGGRRRRMRGGGPVANAAFNWLWGKVKASAAAAAGMAATTETGTALSEVLTAAQTIPVRAAKGVDAAAAKGVRAVAPVVDTVVSAAPTVAGLIGMSYVYSHPSLAVGIADLAARLAARITDAAGGFGPSWPTLYKEILDSAGIAAGAAKDLGSLAANRPYVAATIAWILLDQYAKYKKTNAMAILTKTGNTIAASATGAAESVAAAAAGAGSDLVNVVNVQWKEFHVWMESRPEINDSLRALNAEIKTKMTEKAEAVKKQAAVDGEAKVGAIAPMVPGSSGNEGAASPMAQAGPAGSGGRRLTSRRRRHRASAPRRTRRSSSGRRRGGSRRRRE